MERIREIQQWGSARVGNHSAGGYFYGCTYLKITATDALDLTGTTILRDMFRRSGIDHRGNLAQWDTKVRYIRAHFCVFWEFSAISLL